MFVIFGWMLEKHLKNIEYPTQEQREKELWDISGNLKGRNQVFKFDTRPLQRLSDLVAKKMTTRSKADKVVFESDKHIIVVDAEELHTYVKANRISKIHIQEILDKLDWNIILNKNDV